MTDTDQCCECSDIRPKKDILIYLIKMKRKKKSDIIYYTQ